MVSSEGWIGRRLGALGEAAGLLEELGVDQARPVDVFDAIARLDLWLTFVPLGNLLGAYLPTGHGGIMITTQRQPSIQRYTAAHEIGHRMLDHGSPWLDGEGEILRPNVPERERLAQLFAAYFLMPPPLVHAVATAYGVEPEKQVVPTQVYFVARDMGVSYEAAARQLTELGFLGERDRDRLLKVSPLAAKRAIAHGVRPTISNADVWPVDEQSDGAHLNVVVDDEIVIALPENRTTGYRWMARAALSARDRRRRRPAPAPFGAENSPAPGGPQRPDQPASELAQQGEDWAQKGTREPEAPFQLVADHYAQGWSDDHPRDIQRLRRHLRDTRAVESVTPGIGATGRRWLSLQARAEGTWRYELEYASAHVAFAPPVMAFSLEATVRPEPAVEHRRALLRVNLGDEPPGPLAPGS